MVEFYLDNKTSKLYAYQFRYGTIAFGASDRQSVTLGLDDITVASSAELNDSTIPTWIIDHVKFKFQATLNPADNYGYGHIQTGVLPRGAPSAASAYTNVSDYQELSGWPLTKGESYFYTPGFPIIPGTSATTSWSYTYRPKKILALNRIQDVVMAFNSMLGTFTFFGSVHIQAQRGS